MNPTIFQSTRAACLGLAVCIFSANAQQSTSSLERLDGDVARSTIMDRVASAASGPDFQFAEASPGDDDLGEQRLLTARDRYRSFTLYGGVSEFFTTDASLVEDGIGQDWFTLMQVGANWMPYLGSNLYGDFSVRQDFFRYAEYSSLSFNNTSLGGGLVYVVRQLGDLSVSAKYNFNLLTTAEASSELYHDQNLTFGVQKPYMINRAQLLYTGLTAQIVLEGTPGAALRDQFLFYAGYQAQVTRNLTATAFYQIGYLPFRENQRADWNQILSAGLSYQILEWFSLNTSISGSFNSSNESFYDYSVLNVGAGITATLKF